MFVRKNQCNMIVLDAVSAVTSVGAVLTLAEAFHEAIAAGEREAHSRKNNLLLHGN